MLLCILILLLKQWLILNMILTNIFKKFSTESVIKSVDAEYVNISIYSPLSGSTCIKLSNKLKHPMKGLINIKNNDNKCYIKLPNKLKHPMKGLINIKNNDNICFLWCHIRIQIKCILKKQAKQINKWLIILIIRH